MVYLHNGQEAEIVRELYGYGYIVNKKYKDPNTFAECWGPDEYVEKIFYTAPVELINWEVENATKQKKLLEEEIEDLRLIKVDEDHKRNRAMKMPGFSDVIDFFAGDFACLLNLHNLYISGNDRTKIQTGAQLNDGKIDLYMCDKNHDKIPVMIFKTVDAAVAKRKAIAIQSIKEQSYLADLRTLFNNWVQEVKTDEDISFCFTAKEIELVQVDVAGMETYLKETKEKYGIVSNSNKEG